MSGQTLLGRREVTLLAIASAFITANAYYIHPIIAQVAESFGVSDAWVGAAPAVNQIALALGVLLLLPLGDRVNNARLALICLGAQTLALTVMAMATDFTVFSIASAVLGFFTVTPYLLPAYASKRVAPSQLGFVTAVLTTGVIAGVIGSRAISGVAAEAFGWRSVYWGATSSLKSYCGWCREAVSPLPVMTKQPGFTRAMKEKSSAPMVGGSASSMFSGPTTASAARRASAVGSG